MADYVGPDKMEKIKNHWENVALNSKDKDGLRPTARDPYLQSVVETAIERFLYPGAKLLDIGCGDGLSTLRFSKTTGHALGIDYVESFIKLAQDNARKAGVENTVFEPGDVVNLEQIRNSCGLFDIITTIRCLINLPDWAQQSAAIYQIAQTVKPGGLYITSEGWKEGFDGLNIYRQRAQLPVMEVTNYNCLMTRLQFENEVGKYFDILEYVSLGLYLFLSRLVQPLFTKPESPSHTHHLNKIAADVVNYVKSDASFEFCDYSGVYVLRRFAA
jgi:ubiquinone/menaquinone biosynthesis C-methylase UbiE